MKMKPVRPPSQGATGKTSHMKVETDPPPWVPVPHPTLSFQGYARQRTIMDNQPARQGWFVGSTVVLDSGSDAEPPVSKTQIKIEITGSSRQEATEGADTGLESEGGPSIPTPQASGNARVHKVTLTDNVSVTDSYEAKVVRGHRPPRVITPPWLGLRKPIRIIAGRKFLEDVVEPTMADVHHQHHEAMMRGDDNEARMIQWFGLLRILLVMLWSPIVRLFAKLLRSIAS